MSKWITYGGKRFIDVDQSEDVGSILDDESVKERIDDLVDTLGNDFYPDGLSPTDRKKIMERINESMNVSLTHMLNWNLDDMDSEAKAQKAKRKFGPKASSGTPKLLKQPYDFTHPRILSHMRVGPEVRMLWAENCEDKPMTSRRANKNKWDYKWRLTVPTPAHISLPANENIRRIVKEGQSHTFSTLPEIEWGNYKFYDVARFIEGCRLENIDDEWSDKWKTHGWRWLKYADLTRIEYDDIVDTRKFDTFGKDHPENWDDIIRLYEHMKAKGDEYLFFHLFERVFADKKHPFNMRRWSTHPDACVISSTLEIEEELEAGEWVHRLGTSTLGFTTYHRPRVGRAITIQTHDNGNQEIIRAWYETALPISDKRNEMARLKEDYWKSLSDYKEKGKEPPFQNEEEYRKQLDFKVNTLKLSLYVLNGYSGGNETIGGKEEWLMVLALPSYDWGNTQSIQTTGCALHQHPHLMFHKLSSGEVVLNSGTLSWTLSPKLTEELFGIPNFNAKTYLVAGDTKKWGFLNWNMF